MTCFSPGLPLAAALGIQLALHPAAHGQTAPAETPRIVLMAEGDSAAGESPLRVTLAHD